MENRRTDLVTFGTHFLDGLIGLARSQEDAGGDATNGDSANGDATNANDDATSGDATDEVAVAVKTLLVRFIGILHFGV